jgi:diguanylate cyclase (GGDEF)-like protein
MIRVDTSRPAPASKVQNLPHQPVKGVEPLAFLQAVTSTLDMDRVLAVLNNFLEKVVDHSGWQYRHTELDIKLEGGKNDRHRLEYNLTLSSENIGTFALMRSRRFSEGDQIRIETLLGLTVPALNNALRHRTVVTLLERDALTGLGNRSALARQGAQWLADAIRQKRPLSMIVLDLDDFKVVNDSYGHPAGDRLLVDFADILRANTRTSDLCVRMGGDEFVVLLPGANLTDALGCAERIRLAIAEYANPAGNGDAIKGSVSIGVATYRSGMNMNQLYHQADHALYAAKRAGCNRVMATI